MFRRYELHNHTTQSDASITCEELISIMERDGVDAFAITDHNTISGHRILQRLLKERRDAPQCVYGMEYTTYYGHMLCLNLTRYVPWDSIDRHKPERLLHACRDAGALTGIAHPFSYGDPFARGCRFEMTIHDYSCVDFIEVINNSEPLHEVNERGLLWWEQLILEGKSLAATSGMDLHGRRNMAMQFATYARGERGGDAAKELERAIRARQTWVSKGLLLDCTREAGMCRFSVIDVGKPGFVSSGEGYLLSVKDALGTRVWPMAESLAIDENELFRGGAAIPKLYDGSAVIDRLVCVAPVLFTNERATHDEG